MFSLRTNLIFIITIIFELSSCRQADETVDSKTADQLPYYYEATFTPQWLSDTSQALDTFHKIPNFRLINQLGDTITQQHLDDKIYVADFFFASCPGICPKMTKNMKVIQDSLLSDTSVLLLSHSVTPNKDSVSVLAQYAKDHGVEAHKWYLLTGDRNEIYSLGRNSYFVEEDLGLTKSNDDFLHTENFVLIDQNNHIRGIYNGLNKTSIQQLIKDVHWLKSN